LARRAIPCATDLVLQQAERMFLASFTMGLVGMPGRHLRFPMPGMTEEAEIQEMQNESFYLELEIAEGPCQFIICYILM
jgi:hypothetical protein